MSEDEKIREGRSGGVEFQERGRGGKEVRDVEYYNKSVLESENSGSAKKSVASEMKLEGLIYLILGYPSLIYQKMLYYLSYCWSVIFVRFNMS